MAFRCEHCGEVQVEGTKETKVVTQIRRVKYPQVKDNYGNLKTPEGFEVVKELKLCSNCAATGKFNTVVVGDSKVLV